MFILMKYYTLNILFLKKIFFTKNEKEQNSAQNSATPHFQPNFASFVKFMI